MRSVIMFFEFHEFQISIHQARITNHCCYGLGGGVGRVLGVGCVLGVGLGLGVDVGVAVAVAVTVAVAVAVGVAVAGAVGVTVGVIWTMGHGTTTVMGDPVLKKPIVAYQSDGNRSASNRKLYNVPKRIAFAF